MEEKEFNTTFAIPANYTDSGKIFGGMLEPECGRGTDSDIGRRISGVDVDPDGNHNTHRCDDRYADSNRDPRRYGH